MTSGGAIRKDSPHVQTIISKNSGAQADIHVQHGDNVTFGDLSLEVRATPGHTDGCVTYVLKTRTAMFAFTGDTLLIRGCGRTDWATPFLSMTVFTRRFSLFQMMPSSAQAMITRTEGCRPSWRRKCSTPD